MKKLQQKSILFTTLFILLIAGSCMKDETIKDPLADAKSWYINSISKAKIGLKKNSGKEIEIKSSQDVLPVSQEIYWEKSKAYQLPDGTELVSLPMSVEFEGKARTNGSFMLLISRSSNKYKSIVVYNENKNYFQKDFEASEIQGIYSDAVIKNTQKIAAKKSTNGRLMVLPPPDPQCYDAYWATIWYDEYDNIIAVEFTFLYTYCTEPGGTPGDPQTLPEPVFNWGEVDDTDGSTTLLSIVEGEPVVVNGIANDKGEEFHKVDWTCYKINGNQMWFQSYEKAKITYMGATPSHYYYWVAGLEHLSITATGELDPGQSAELFLNHATDKSTPEYFQMELSVKERRTISQNNKTTVKNSEAKLARSRAWTLYYFGH